MQFQGLSSATGTPGNAVEVRHCLLHGEEERNKEVGNKKEEEEDTEKEEEEEEAEEEEKEEEGEGKRRRGLTISSLSRILHWWPKETFLPLGPTS